MRTYLNKNFLLLIFLLAPALVQAADAAPAQSSGSMNVMLIGLVSLVVILFFAIAVLGNTLRQLGFVYRDKMRAERRAKGLMKSVVLLLAAGLASVSAYAQDAAAEAAPVSTSIAGMAKSDFYALIGIITVELLVVVALTLLIRNVARMIGQEIETEASPAKTKAPKVNFWDRFNNVVSIEKEQDIMLDHDYDGIKELDNSLPPWWKYGFYLTIVVAIVYIWYYHAGGNGPSSYDEYVAEVQKGEADKAAYLAKSANNVDENTVTMGDAASIAAGKTIFETTCAACHAKDGGGGVGPNFTDEYWLHGGSIKDVFKSIKYGWPDKGMKSWKDDFSPKQIADLASYVKSLKGTTPAAPKEKQGELYIEGGAAPATDSTKATTDSTKKVAIN